LKCHNL